MPEVVFMAPTRGREPQELLRADAPEGGSLGDLCDDVGAPIPFSCRSASCGTCRVRVLAGDDLLEPPEDDERELLELFRKADSSAEAGITFRLACQVRMRRGPGCIIIRPADDEP